MGEIYNIDEIFEMACQIERNGARFYQRAAGMTSDDETKKVLLSLADMEVDHEERFSAMREQIVPRREELAARETDEVALYLRAIAGGYVFKKGGDPAAELTGNETIREILETAIRLEKDSIAFYVGIKEAVPERLGKAKVNDILKEEIGHVALLSEKLRALSG